MELICLAEYITESKLHPVKFPVEAEMLRSDDGKTRPLRWEIHKTRNDQFVKSRLMI